MPELVAALLSEERLGEAARVQAERRAKMEHVTSRTPAESAYLFGLARAEHALSLLDAQGDAASVLAEAYALQGSFGEAAAVEPDAEKRAGYAARARAIERAGSFICECPPESWRPKRGDAKGETYRTRHPVEEVFDGERAYRISKCLKCGAVSAETA